ncbi:HAD family phosphatase [Candidatus Woesearchaeota archaeon]|nr:HAD family phosphatase [Candidatus Woesearchaeota archaeon]
MAIEAILLDYNGLIVDTTYARFETNKRVLKKYFNIDLNWKDYEISWLEKRRGLSDLLRERNLPLEKIKQIKHIRARLFKEHKLKIRPMPNAIRFLDRIGESETRFKLGLVSNNYQDEVDVGLELFILRRYFEVIITADNVRFLKPNPAPYLLASKRLGIKPPNCLCLENSGIGVKAAKSAGMHCIAIPFSYKQEEGFQLADSRVNDISKVTIKLISEIEARESPFN